MFYWIRTQIRSIDCNGWYVFFSLFLIYRFLFYLFIFPGNILVEESRLFAETFPMVCFADCNLWCSMSFPPSPLYFLQMVAASTELIIFLGSIFWGLEHFIGSGAFFCQEAHHIWLSIIMWYVMIAAVVTQYLDPLLHVDIPILKFYFHLLARIFVYRETPLHQLFDKGR